MRAGGGPTKLVPRDSPLLAKARPVPSTPAYCALAAAKAGVATIPPCYALLRRCLGGD